VPLSLIPPNGQALDRRDWWLLITAYKVAVTIAFYGYARQAVSILPAVVAVEAMALDAVLGLAARAVPGAGRSVRWPALACGIPILALMGLDVAAAYRAAPPAHTGNAWPSPRWGTGAFESVSDLWLFPSR
jgi:hypothetical protein